MDYVKAFLIGGLLCLIGQILIDKTKLTPARILVSYVVIGVLLGAVGGNVVTDAFGIVAMVAMTPLITVQLMGLVAQLRTRKARRLQPAAMGAAFAGLPDDDIIEL